MSAKLCKDCIFLATAPQCARASSFLRFLDHTQRRIAVGRTPLDEWSARRTDLYLTTHNTRITQCARASSFLRFLDHTQRRTTVGKTPLDEWSARRTDLYLTTHNTRNRKTEKHPFLRWDFLLFGSDADHSLIQVTTSYHFSTYSIIMFWITITRTVSSYIVIFINWNTLGRNIAHYTRYPTHFMLTRFL